jgi:hypothetical protein
MPPWSSGCDAGFSARKRGFESRRGFLVVQYVCLAVGERATPPVSGTGDRWFDSSQPDLLSHVCDARWRSGFPREPHELETWVRIPPAQFGGRSSEARALACQAIGRRFESGRPRSWWLWCNGSIRGRDPRGTGSSPVGRLHADAEHRRAQRAVTPSLLAVVVRLHPSALIHPGDEAHGDEHLACTEEERVRLPPSPLRASVVSTAQHAPVVRPRCRFDSCRRLLPRP